MRGEGDWSSNEDGGGKGGWERLGGDGRQAHR